jgi:5-methyltetrahydropteroyltriglutamate--homocysteine methyltransferase
MPIPTEPIGSLPRPLELVAALAGFERGLISAAHLAEVADSAVRDTIRNLEQSGSPVVTDGEQRKPSFATYPLQGMESLSSDGAVIEFSDGHRRQLPKLTKGPFRYQHYADQYLKAAQSLTSLPVKQAVISPSALSLLYQDAIPCYSNRQFVDDLVREAESDIRRCLVAGAHCVQIDFTEGRLSLKIDPSGGLLQRFIELNNLVLCRFSEPEQARIGVHSCPGGDQDATHSASVDYELLLPALFALKAGRFYIQLASEPDRPRVLRAIQTHLEANQTVFVGVIDPIDPQVESPEEVRERVMEAASYLPLDRLGTTDDCGFAPFADDVSTSRDTAFAKIAARVAGTRLAEKALGVV